MSSTPGQPEQDQPRPGLGQTELVEVNVRRDCWAPGPELVVSARTSGLVQPPVAYRDGGERVLVRGHRRTDRLTRRSATGDRKTELP